MEGSLYHLLMFLLPLAFSQLFFVCDVSRVIQTSLYLLLFFPDLLWSSLLGLSVLEWLHRQLGLIIKDRKVLFVLLEDMPRAVDTERSRAVV